MSITSTPEVKTRKARAKSKTKRASRDPGELREAAQARRRRGRRKHAGDKGATGDKVEPVILSPSPLAIDKPNLITHQFVKENDGMPEFIDWIRTYTGRGINLTDAKLAKLMDKPGASVTFDPAWTAWLMQTFVMNAMRDANPKADSYEAVKGHCSAVFRGHTKEMRARLLILKKHQEAGMGSERSAYVDLWKIFTKHYRAL